MASPSEMIMLQEKGFTLDKMIGEGSYAKVYKSIHMLDETRHEVLACKVINTALSPREYLVKFLPRELDTLIRVNHPHIVAVNNIFQRRAKYYIFLRFAENGDLLEYLTRHGAVPENQSRLWMRQLISGLNYIHTLNIAHRDLKCENVLITSNYNVKLTDFGFARTVRCRDQDVLSETFCGSLSYAAPEILKGIPYHPKMADMWSMGIILYTMLNRALPFNETSAKKLYEKQIKQKWRFRTSVVNELTSQCKATVLSLMEPEAAARPTATAVLNGPWITMDSRLCKLTTVEDSLLKQAVAANENPIGDETEIERIANIRQKSRKEGLQTLKTADLSSQAASKAIFDE